MYHGTGSAHSLGRSVACLTFWGGLVLLTPFALLWTAPAQAADWVVNSTGIGDDFPTIQAAISSPLVSGGDTIMLRDGTYTGPGNRDVDFSGKGVVVRSLSLNAPSCVIDCQGSPSTPHRGFRFDQGESSAAQLEAITIVNGYTMGTPGAGIFIDGTASPMIVGCVVLNCTANGSRGGGIWCGGTSTPSILNCRILNNTAHGEGGGISVMGSASASINACEVRSNAALSPLGGGQIGSGGGIFTLAGNIDYCVVTNNFAEDEGGGIYAYGTQIAYTEVLTNITFGRGGGVHLRYGSSMLFSTVQGNAGTGGGVFTSSSTLFRCTITGNTALASYGGGVESEESSIQMCTISGNRALIGGGVSATQTTLDSSIIWGNCATSQGNEIYQSFGAVTLTCCCVDPAGVAGSVNYSGNQVFTDPRFCGPLDCSSAPTTGGEYTLDAFSPCMPDNNTCGILIGAQALGCNTADVADAAATGTLGLFVPAVVRAGTDVSWSLPQAGRARVTVHDIQGRTLAVLMDEESAGAGMHRAQWSGRDERGARLPRGVYFARLESSAGTIARRAILLGD